ncbi:MAG: cell division protein FtsZ [Rhodospirillales bacterium]
MTINLSVPTLNAVPELRPRITVVGCGGAGGNAVNNMIRAKLEGVEFAAANTDAQALAQSLAERRIQLGVTVTQGLGAGSRPDIGRIAAEEALEEIIEQIRGSNMVFIAAGMGGGTGTGAAPVIARAAREQGILTVGVVTKPFHFEGAHRMRIADSGIEELEQFVDTLIIIPNQNLFRIANERTTFADAFKMADDVLYSGVRGVTDLMVMPGLINLDFADIRAVMSEMGKAMMGTGEANGDRRALDAAEAAISNPLLDDISMKGARGVLINITGSYDMTLFEVDEAANRIRSEVDQDAFIIFGSTFDDTMEGRIRVSVVATGMEIADALKQQPPKAGGVVSRLSDARQQIVGRGRDEAAARPAAESHPAEVAYAEAELPREAVRADASERHYAATGTDGSMSNVFIAPAPVSKSDVEVSAAAGHANGGRPAEADGPRSRMRMSNLLARIAGTGGPKPVSGPAMADTADDAAYRKAPRLGGLSASERLPSSQAEEDLLDIPAFLRRQAN